MTRPADGSGPRRRAERLLRWYPASWRDRYGAEFAELLIAELTERPRSWRRGADVARGGLVARLGRLGLTGPPAASPAQAGRTLATLACAAAVFGTVAAAMWAQLTIGWRWSPPDTAATSAAMLLMSGAALALLMLAAAAAAPVAWTLLRLAVRGRASGLAGPSALFLAAAAVLVLGGRHFGNGWPGTGGHPWAHQGLVPAGLAAFGWAATLSVTSYWAHPAALLAFPAAEIAWMVISPAAIGCAVAGAATAVRRLEACGRVLRYQAGIARCAAFCMLIFIAGAGSWVVAGGPGPRHLFHTGVIDAAGLAVLVLALAVAGRAARQASRAARLTHAGQ